MPKYKYCNYNQTVMVPISFDQQILSGTFEHSISYLVDHQLDLTIFHHRFKNDDTGRPAYNPAILLKIVLLAYSRGGPMKGTFLKTLAVLFRRQKLLRIIQTQGAILHLVPLIFLQQPLGLMLQGRQTDSGLVPFDLGNNQLFAQVIHCHQVDLVFVSALPVAANPIIFATSGIQVVKEALQDLAGPAGIITFNDLANVAKIAGLDR